MRLSNAAINASPGIRWKRGVKCEQLFHAGDLEQAEAMTEMVLKQNSNDVQAGYLLRVIEREKKSQPAAMSKSH